MAQRKTLRPGYKVVYPNRDKAASKTTKSIVVILILVSVALMLLVTIGGWSRLQGLKPVNLLWCAIYLVIAYYIMRWNRGLLPIAAGGAIMLLMLSLIAGTGVAGTSWFDRSHPGFAAPQTFFGTSGLTPDILGALTLIMVPVSALLIIFSMQGFSQGWNVEQEVREDEANRRSGSESAPPGEPATA